VEASSEQDSSECCLLAKGNAGGYDQSERSVVDGVKALMPWYLPSSVDLFESRENPACTVCLLVMRRLVVDTLAPPLTFALRCVKTLSPSTECFSALENPAPAAAARVANIFMHPQNSRFSSGDGLLTSAGFSWFAAWTADMEDRRGIDSV